MSVAARADDDGEGWPVASDAVGSGAAHQIVHVEDVMGTVASFRITPSPDAAPDVVERLVRAACASLHDADAVFSTWRPQSPLSRVRRGELPVAGASPDIGLVLDLCEKARDASGAWFDPWAMPGGVDPTGLVKGWAVERALDVLQTQDVIAASINAGGDIAVFGPPPEGGRWRFGVRHPWRDDALACVVHVDSALATSGTYERGDHLVDPHSGEHRARAVSASVIGPSLAFADAFATALAVGGDDALGALASARGYEGYLIRPDGTEAWTDGMAFAD